MTRFWILLAFTLAGGGGRSPSVLPSPAFQSSVEVVVSDLESGRPIPDVEISILSAVTFRTLAEGLFTDATGRLSTTLMVEPDEVSSESYWVSPAFPNPILARDRAVTIRYAVVGDTEDHPVLEVIDVLGRRINLNQFLPAGVYFYRLRFGGRFTSAAQAITINEGKRLDFGLVPEPGKNFLVGGNLLQGVGRLRTETIIVAKANSYSTREEGVYLYWPHEQSIQIALTGVRPKDSRTARSTHTSQGFSSSHRAEVVSPDGRTSVQLTIQNTDVEDCLFYRILRDGTPVVRDSRLGLEISGASPLGCGLRIAGVSSKSASTMWRPPFGQNEVVADIHNALHLELSEAAGRKRGLGIDVKAFDAGVAFRYRLDEKSGVRGEKITSELTQVRFPDRSVAYAQYGHEEPYVESPIYALEPKCWHPLTLDLLDGQFAVFAEAGNANYPLSWIERAEGTTANLHVTLRDDADISAGSFTTPWRVILLGDEPADLIESSHIVEALSEPNQLEDTGWIQPGKVIRAVYQTQDAKRAVDFADQRDIDYIIFDAGWYGDQWSVQSDATEPVPGLDIVEVVDYADGRGVGVFLYVNDLALRRQLDEILPTYRRWGIRGIKPGFVEVGSQESTVWLRNMVKEAAEFELVVNIHDAYRPDGFSRTYPNLLTQEGLRGNEHMPGARHNTTLPFSRFIIGAADYTPGYGNEKIGTSFAHQLALAVVFYSPLQFLFWTDNPMAYRDDQAVSFWSAVPTVWDETRVLNGRIGEHVTVARRSDDEWFIGSITNEHARTLEISLDFLDPGRSYEAVIYKDDISSEAGRPPVQIEVRTVDSEADLQIVMAESGGQAVYIR